MAILQVANIHHDASGYTRTQISTANNLTWYTSNAEKMRLDLGGNLAIGRTATTYKLDVVGTANSAGWYQDGTLIQTIANSYATTITNANLVSAYTQANTVGIAANTYATTITNANLVLAYGYSNTVFNNANNKFIANNISGTSLFSGNVYVTTGNVVIGRTDNSSYLLDVNGTINAASILVNGAQLSTGGGDFNTNIGNSLAAQLNTDLTDVFTAPSTAGKSYIIRSIHVTNIGSADATANGEFQGTNYANASFCATIPVPTQSSVELLKKPKIMQPNDILRLLSDTASTLHATISYEIQSSSSYFGAGAAATSDATYVDLYTATSSSVLESILLINVDGTYDVKARCVWTDGSNNIQGYFCYDMVIPADSTVELLDVSKNLPSGYKVRIYGNVGNRLEAIIAGKAS